ncbi:tripartite tricarboxylate transporter TctB family protein [Jiella sonneratiae]|uniref:Tripartite tricarboxylate transporter TctB family protein n=1 Tax=Jiella sonneratiae TaxID=2816856 RepID=A0ABS3J313_9HYPH|nr:tripartite tricarboxylate transporter TctB family protein [Jiella sonneratiae]MBO0904054.1 tripartite tricarboxylate transporter TctB family protein [Jiella sonneratiae]
MRIFNVASFAIITGFGLLLALQLPGISPAARTYPLVMIVLVVVSSAVVAVREVAGWAGKAPLDGKLNAILTAPSARQLRLAAFVAVWLAYWWVLPVIGFMIATALAIFASLYVLKTRSLLLAALVAAVFAILFSVLFTTVLYVPVPLGALDEALIEWIYALQH